MASGLLKNLEHSMNKKLSYFLVLVACLIGGYCLVSSKKPHLADDYCAFCDREVLDAQKFYEDDLVLALYTHKPILPGHCLIIPKRHVQRYELLSDEEVAQMSRVINKVNQAAIQVFKTSPYLIYQKNGLEVGQSVPHVHFHYLPRNTGDFSIFKLILKMCIANVRNPISSTEMQEVVEEMKMAMN